MSNVVPCGEPDYHPTLMDGDTDRASYTDRAIACTKAECMISMLRRTFLHLFYYYLSSWKELADPVPPGLPARGEALIQEQDHPQTEEEAANQQ